MSMSKNLSILIFVILADVLRQILPPEFAIIPSGYEIIGDIAHMNLPDKMLGYKYIIG